MLGFKKLPRLRLHEINCDDCAISSSWIARFVPVLFDFDVLVVLVMQLDFLTSVICTYSKLVILAMQLDFLTVLRLCTYSELLSVNIR